jgi:hypothetical protein
MPAHFSAASAQESKPKIVTTGTDSTFEQALSQPTEFLQNIGITPEEVQHELRPRTRILVEGAGFTRDIGLVAFTDAQNSQGATSSIHVEGAGAARNLGLVAFTENPDPQSSKSGIQVAGAGSARDIGLVSPLSQ